MHATVSDSAVLQWREAAIIEGKRDSGSVRETRQARRHGPGTQRKEQERRGEQTQTFNGAIVGPSQSNIWNEALSNGSWQYVGKRDWSKLFWAPN